jgi:hypothetical protein
MSDFDYKKYSLERLEEWVHDSLSASEASPQEIYDVIKKTVEEYYYCYKNHTSRAYELLALLNGNGKGHLSCDKDDPSPECKKEWNSFWEENYYPEEINDCMPPWGHSDMEALQYTEEELNAMCDAAQKQQDKVKKWVLPVDNLGECYFVSFPDDLLEAANLAEGDQIEWVDNGDGSYLLKKVK